MKLCTFKIKNFRGFSDEISIDFDNITVFIGKNDVGKSTVLDALDIFFNAGKGAIKPDKDDVNIACNRKNDFETCITAVFSELPDSIIIDAEHHTSLRAEYLLNHDGNLEIVKKFKNGGSIKTYIRAFHPTHSNCADLLLKKNSELKSIVHANNIPCNNLTVNSLLRAAIWKHFFNDLQLSDIEIDASKEDAKQIAEKLTAIMPIYSLFQSDRKNSDEDGEIQDPLQEAVKQIIRSPEMQQKLNSIADQVRKTLEDVSNRTLEKLNEMAPNVAETLSPVIPETSRLEWAKVFKSVSITGDDIPINKRGSGIKRLILLNFFRAEAERCIRENKNSALIYAIEEPETSQHIYNQQILIQSFKKLACSANTQVILTTHSTTVVKEFNFCCLRLIEDTAAGKLVRRITQKSLCYPSLNEVNYLAFDDMSIEYHNELYGYLVEQKKIQPYKLWCTETISYIKLQPNGSTKTENITLTEFIRHKIHHPENPHNRDFTKEELARSIQMMRTFIKNNR